MFFLELLATFNEKQKAEMRVIYKEAEIILKIMVASIKASQRKLDRESSGQSKIKNQKKWTVSNELK
jgi:hypothetical protein